MANHYIPLSRRNQSDAEEFNLMHFSYSWDSQQTQHWVGKCGGRKMKDIALRPSTYSISESQNEQKLTESPEGRLWMAGKRCTVRQTKQELQQTPSNNLIDLNPYLSFLRCQIIKKVAPFPCSTQNVSILPPFVHPFICFITSVLLLEQSWLLLAALSPERLLLLSFSCWLIPLQRDFLLTFLNRFLHCAAVLVMPEDEVPIATISEHIFSFSSTCFGGALPFFTCGAGRSISSLENLFSFFAPGNSSSMLPVFAPWARLILKQHYVTLTVTCVVEKQCLTMHVLLITAHIRVAMDDMRGGR